MTDPILPELVTIPAGQTRVGSQGQVYLEEEPATMVEVAEFAMARYPVTVAEYDRFVQTGQGKPRKNWGGLHPPVGIDNHPVVGCSWRDARAYCQWLTDITARPYRLPSEAEWERAAHGDQDWVWPWGDEFSPSRANTQEAGKNRTTPVTAHPDGASPWGILDMAGNAWEWAIDLYRPYPYRPTRDEEVPLLEAGTPEDRRRVLRGGSWMAEARYARCAARTAWYPAMIFSGQVGFRVICSHT